MTNKEAQNEFFNFDAPIIKEQALEQEPCEDAISRRAVKVWLEEMDNKLNREKYNTIAEYYAVKAQMQKLIYICDIPKEKSCLNCKYNNENLYRGEHCGDCDECMLWEQVEQLPSVTPQQEDIAKDGTLTVKVADGRKVTRVLVCGDNHFGGLYYPDEDAEPKTGHWITEIKSDLRGDMWPTNPRCSECGGEPYYSNTIYNYKFCPYCGKKMVEPQESEG